MDGHSGVAFGKSASHPLDEKRIGYTQDAAWKSGYFNLSSSVNSKGKTTFQKRETNVAIAMESNGKG